MSEKRKKFIIPIRSGKPHGPKEFEPHELFINSINGGYINGMTNKNKTLKKQTTQLKYMLTILIL